MKYLLKEGLPEISSQYVNEEAVMVNGEGGQMKMEENKKDIGVYINRELSWLQFNENNSFHADQKSGTWSPCRSFNYSGFAEQ